MKVQVFGLVHSRALRALWILEEMRVPYELVLTGIPDGTSHPDYLKINPNGRIPAVRDGEVTLFESLAINFYLAEKYKAGMWPATVEDRALAYQWSFWATNELEGYLLPAVMHKIVLPVEQRDPAVIARALETVRKPLQVLDAALAKRQYLAGDSFTVGDINVAMILNYLRMIQADIAYVPHVNRWLDVCLTRPALQKALGG
jgi:glutathione S-transferase